MSKENGGPEVPSLDDNEALAKKLGYKFACCLCCGNHDTKVCEECEVSILAERSKP